MFGLSFDKLLLIGGVAIFLLGPQRLPMYAARLGQLVRNVRQMADGARDRMREEMGAEVFDEIDWKRLDPRQYDPRRIIRDALIDEVGGTGTASGPLSAPSAAGSPATTTVIGASGVAAAAASSAASGFADAGSGGTAAGAQETGGVKPARAARLAAGAVPPFDAEAT